MLNSIIFVRCRAIKTLKIPSGQVFDETFSKIRFRIIISAINDARNTFFFFFSFNFSLFGILFYRQILKKNKKNRNTPAGSYNTLG